MPEKFFVMPDDGMELVIGPLRSAKRSIDIYVFTLSNADILGALRDAASRGVAVRALVDKHPSGNKEAGRAALESLKEAGVDARPVAGLLHAYACQELRGRRVADADIERELPAGLAEDPRPRRDHDGCGGYESPGRARSRRTGEADTATLKLCLQRHWCLAQTTAGR